METQSVEVPNGNTLPPGAPDIPSGSGFDAAYQRRLPEIKAVSPESLSRLNLDVHAVVATVLGALPEILVLRDALAKLPDLNMALVDGLEDYAQACGEANSRFDIATRPSEDIVEMNDEAMAMRETIHSDAVALANRGLIDRSKLKTFQGLTGYKNVAFELVDWANVMREAWPVIQGKTALTLEEIQSAKQLGERLVRAAGLREQAPAVIADVALTRQQALFLLVDAYDEVRRGIGFLRWRQEDADTIAPSLYAGKTRKPAAEQPAPAPAEPAPPGEPAVPPVNAGGTAEHAAPVAAAPVGLPGNKPFALV